MEGPKLPRPENLAKSKILQDTFKFFTDTLNAGKNGTIRGGWSHENASFSMAIVGRDSPKPLWEYHVRAPSNPRGTKVVDGDSQYHIGSLSKLITTLVLKKSGIDMEKPITYYVPELNKTESKIKFNEITLTMLAGHLGGLPTNCV